MPENILASIVIPVHNKLGLTRKCLDAIYANTPSSPAWEIIVVDNGSADGTRCETARDERTLFARNPDNLGFSKACNYGATLAAGRYLVFLNNDTEVQPGWLEPLAEELARNPRAGLVGARLIYPDCTIQHAGVAIMANRLPWHIHTGLDVNDPLARQRRSFQCVTGACIAARREEFLAMGGFDENYLNGYEDVDLCLRYRRSGFECVYRPDCVVIHHESKSDGRHDHDGKNLEILRARWQPTLEQDDFKFACVEAADPAKPLRFALKIGCPSRKEIHWGDIYFAESFARALARAGHDCAIHYLDEWDGEDRDMDVAVHIGGLGHYKTKPWNINIFWMISHPDLHPLAELNEYDGVAVASLPYAAHLAKIARVPVGPLLQAADPGIFAPVAARKNRKETKEIVFVGNNGGTGRGDMRAMAKWLLPENPFDAPEIACAIYGKGWEGRINPLLIKGYCEWKRQPEIFCKAGIVLNDHHADMAENGFVNDRTYQVMACGAPLICDRVRGLGELLDVPQVSSREELRSAIAYILEHPEETKARAKANREIVIRDYNFDKRVEELTRFLIKIETPELRARVKASRAALTKRVKTVRKEECGRVAGMFKSGEKNESL